MCCRELRPSSQGKVKGFVWGRLTTRAFKINFKVNTLGCHPNWPRRRVSARPLDSRAFYCCEIEAAQGGWTCFSHRSDSREKTSLRRFPRCGFQPAQKTRGFPPLARRHFRTRPTAFTPYRFSAGVFFGTFNRVGFASYPLLAKSTSLFRLIITNVTHS